VGVEFVSVSEQIDTSTPAGKLVFTILGAVGELEGRPLQQRNILRVLHQVRLVGFPCFSEISTDLAQEKRHSERPRTLLDGHAPEEVGNLNSKLKDDVAFRQEWAERVGLGFQLVHIGPQNVVGVETKKVA
jgi:hypothetical protein